MKDNANRRYLPSPDFSNMYQCWKFEFSFITFLGSPHTMILLVGHFEGSKVGLVKKKKKKKMKGMEPCLYALAIWCRNFKRFQRLKGKALSNHATPVLRLPAPSSFLNWIARSHLEHSDCILCNFLRSVTQEQLNGGTSVVQGDQIANWLPLKIWIL